MASMAPLLMLQSDSPTGSYVGAATSAAEEKCWHGGIGGRADPRRNRTQDAGLEGPSRIHPSKRTRERTVPRDTMAREFGLQTTSAEGWSMSGRGAPQSG